MNTIKRIFIKTGYLLLLLPFGCSEKSCVNQVNSDIYEGIEFEMPMVDEPVFPEYSVTITDFGAVNDGQTLNTDAFADAIADVSEKGGGCVLIPRGLWLTGPIIIKSNVNIHAEAGALVIFSKNKDLYPLIESNWEGWKTVRCLSPISGKDLENIAITGDGVFDGSGEVWRLVKREKMTDAQWKKLVNSGGIESEDGRYGTPQKVLKEGARKQQNRDHGFPIIWKITRIPKISIAR